MAQESASYNYFHNQHEKRNSSRMGNILFQGISTNHADIKNLVQTSMRYHIILALSFSLQIILPNVLESTLVCHEGK